MSSHIPVNEKGFTVVYEGEHPIVDIVFVHGFTGHPKDTWFYKAKSQSSGNQAKQHAQDRNSSDAVWRSRIRKLHLFYRRPVPTASTAPSVQSNRTAETKGLMEIEGQRQEHIYWPADLASQTVPGSRILTYGYDTRIGHRLTGRLVSKKSVYDHAWDFLCEFEHLRRNLNEKDRPVIFIAHSLGGIIIKEALRRSRGCKSTKPYLYSIFEAVSGILFFGTPHRGADPRTFLHYIISASAQILGVQVNKDIVDTLVPNAEGLAQLMDEFLIMAQEKGFRVYSFQEEYGLKSLFDAKVVEDWSSCLNNPVFETKQFISSNHMDMCRFSGLGDTEYTKVAAALTHILAMIESRASTVKRRQTSRGSQPPGMGPEPSIPEHGIPNSNGSHRVLGDPHQALIERLYFTEIDERLTNLAAAQSGTCRWVPSTPAYTSWRDTTEQSDHGGFLWIWGHPGTGKSTLMKLLFEEAKRDAKLSRNDPASPITLSFFFLAQGTVEERSTFGLYRSLLYQLFEEAADLKASLSEALTPSGTKNIQTKGWNEEALKQTLTHAVRKLGDRPLTIFVDALDECDDDQARDMVGFFEDLCEVAQDKKIQLRICLSSRHYPHIVTKGRNIILENEAGHKNDIEQYIKKKLRLPTSKDAQSLRTRLLEASQMIFLWVVLVVDILNKDYPGKSIKQMGRRLQEIPKELGDLFKMILQRDGENPEALQLCLKWILFAERPMKLQELYFAVQFGLDEEDCSGAWNRDSLDLDAMEASVKVWSKGLAEIKGRASVVQFIHESVRDCLLGRYKHHWDEAPENMEGRGHEILKNCCLAQVKAAVAQGVHMRHISMQSNIKAIRNRETIISEFPFLIYSIFNILHHANSAQGCGLDQGGFLDQFPLECWKALNNLFEKVDGRKYRAGVNLLYLLAERNLVNLIKLFPVERSCFYLEAGIRSSPRYGPPIFAALAHGSKEAARALLEAEVKGQPSESRLRGLLEYCPAKTLELGTFNITFDFEKKKGPLLYVAEQGYTILLEVLLNTALYDVDVNCRDPSSGLSPLSHVARRGLLDMAALLLEKGADIAQMDKSGRAPLSYAAELGHRDMVMFLLEKGAGLEQRDGDGRGLLSHAMRHLGMVTLLLEKGADIAQSDRHGRTPVSYAAEFGDPDIVRLLLEKGADLEQKDMYGRGPISYAAERGHRSTATLLLFQSGLVFDMKDERGRTPLAYASRSGYASIVEALIQKGANMEQRDRDGRTPLSLAADGFETEAVVKMLCDSGAQIDTKDRQGRSPLSLAAGVARNTSVKVLCASGAQVDSKDVHGRTPLSWAAEMGNYVTIQLLGEHGPQVDAQDEQGRTPLSWAAQAERVCAVYFLLSMGADVGSEDNQGHTPLWYATCGTQAPNRLVIDLLRRRVA